MSVLGLKTVIELRDLLAAKDLEVSALGKAYESFKPTWDSNDKTASDEWLDDYRQMRHRYLIARKDAVKRLNAADNSTISPLVITAQDEWDGIILALKQNGDAGKVTKGDAFDLYNRLAKAGGPNPLPFGEIQPAEGVDFDLNTFNKSGDFLTKIDPELAGKKGLSLLEKLAIGTIAVAAVGATASLVTSLNDAANLAKTLTPKKGKR